MAARSGLEAKVRLAGDAVRVARRDGIEDSEYGRDLRAKVEAGAGGHSWSPFDRGCVDTRAVSEEQLAGIGGFTRPLGEILTEVAEDRSSLIHMG